MAAAQDCLHLLGDLWQQLKRPNMTFQSQTVTVVTEQLLTFGNDSLSGEIKAEIPLQRWPVADNPLCSDP